MQEGCHIMTFSYDCASVLCSCLVALLKMYRTSLSVANWWIRCENCSVCVVSSWQLAAFSPQQKSASAQLILEKINSLHTCHDRTLTQNYRDRKSVV